MKRFRDIINPDLTFPEEGYGPGFFGVFIEICKDATECHSCGKYRKNNCHVTLQHLCQHFFSLCPECMDLLLKKLGVAKREAP